MEQAAASLSGWLKTGSGGCYWQDNNQQATVAIQQSFQTFQGLFNQSPAADEEVGGQLDEPAPPITLETPLIICV